MAAVTINSVADLGRVLRASRKTAKVRQDVLALQAGVGHVFVRDIEHGKPTIQMGRALQVLASAGLALQVVAKEKVE